MLTSDTGLQVVICNIVYQHLTHLSVSTVKQLNTFDHLDISKITELDSAATGVVVVVGGGGSGSL